MLHEFITTYRDEIIARARGKLTDRPWPLVSTSELEHGVPLFLTQLTETLRWETTPTPFSQKAIAASAVKHGRELRALGFNISQVVHDYGDICQAITEVAVEQHLPITSGEFHTLNRCLDTAIAEAVTEHARLTADLRSTEEIERSGQLAHEIRDIVSTATRPVGPGENRRRMALHDYGQKILSASPEQARQLMADRTAGRVILTDR